MSNRNVILLIGAVMAVVFLMVFMVLSNAKKKPQSPQAMVAAALNTIFTTQEWQPGMGPQPFLYHPAAQNNPVWNPLPVQAAASAPPAVSTPQTPGMSFGQALVQKPAPVAGSAPGGAGTWMPLPGAAVQGGAVAFQQQGIRAYTGPVQ